MVVPALSKELHEGGEHRKGCDQPAVHRVNREIMIENQHRSKAERHQHADQQREAVLDAVESLSIHLTALNDDAMLAGRLA